MRILNNDIYMTRGDTESLTIYCTDESGNIIDFVQVDTVYFTVKHSIYSDENLIQKKITTFSEGKAIIEIEPEDTKNMAYGNYRYDIQLTTFDDNVITLIRPSLFTVEGEITYD